MSDLKWISILVIIVANFFLIATASRASRDNNGVQHVPGRKKLCKMMRTNELLNAIIVDKVTKILELDALERAQKPCNKMSKPNGSDKTEIQNQIFVQFFDRNQTSVEINRQPLKNENEIVPQTSPKIDIGKLNWTDASFGEGLTGIDFTTITAVEMTKILDDIMRNSNCPAGSFHQSGKGCVPVGSPSVAVPQMPSGVEFEELFNQPLSGSAVATEHESSEGKSKALNVKALVEALQMILRSNSAKSVDSSSEGLMNIEVEAPEARPGNQMNLQASNNGEKMQQNVAGVEAEQTESSNEANDSESNDFSQFEKNLVELKVTPKVESSEGMSHGTESSNSLSGLDLKALQQLVEQREHEAVADLSIDEAKPTTILSSHPWVFDSKPKLSMEIGDGFMKMSQGGGSMSPKSGFNLENVQQLLNQQQQQHEVAADLPITEIEPSPTPTSRISTSAEPKLNMKLGGSSMVMSHGPSFGNINPAFNIKGLKQILKQQTAKFTAHPLTAQAKHEPIKGFAGLEFDSSQHADHHGDDSKTSEHQGHHLEAHNDLDVVDENEFDHDAFEEARNQEEMIDEPPTDVEPEELKPTQLPARYNKPLTSENWLSQVFPPQKLSSEVAPLKKKKNANGSQSPELSMIIDEGEIPQTISQDGKTLKSSAGEISPTKLTLNLSPTTKAAGDVLFDVEGDQTNQFQLMMNAMNRSLQQNMKMMRGWNNSVVVEPQIIHEVPLKLTLKVPSVAKKVEAKNLKFDYPQSSNTPVDGKVDGAYISYGNLGKINANKLKSHEQTTTRGNKSLETNDDVTESYKKKNSMKQMYLVHAVPLPTHSLRGLNKDNVRARSTNDAPVENEAKSESSTTITTVQETQSPTTAKPATDAPPKAESTTTKSLPVLKKLIEAKKKILSKMFPTLFGNLSDEEADELLMEDDVRVQGKDFQRPKMIYESVEGKTMADLLEDDVITPTPQSSATASTEPQPVLTTPQAVNEPSTRVESTTKAFEVDRDETVKA